MRQAVTTTIVGLLLGLSPLTRAEGGGTDATGSIAQARRLIEAKDHASAMIVLEDLLLEAHAKDKPAIVDLLRQSYKVLARQAEEAGRDGDAAHYRDNLAILEKVRPGTISADSADQSARRNPKMPTGLEPPPRASTDSGTNTTVQPRPLPIKISQVGPEPGSRPALLPEPAALPDPAKMAIAGPPRQPPPAASPSSLPSNPTGAPDSPTARNRDPDGNAGDSDLALAPSAPPSAPSPSAGRSRTATERTAGPKQPLAGPMPEDADRLFSAKQYIEAGRCYAALAGDNRLPANRKNHWAYCRMVEVAQRMNARPRSAPEWDAIEAEIQSIQRIAPNLWYGEYLRNKLAEVRQGRRRPRAQSDNLVVRGSAPDESQGQSPSQSGRFPRLFGKSSAATPAQPETAAAPTPLPSGSSSPNADRPLNTPGAGRVPRQPLLKMAPPARIASQRERLPPAARSLRSTRTFLRAGIEPTAPEGVAWQVHETPNFRIFHCDARLAEAAGQAAEAARAVQAKRWGSPALQRPWAPRCDIYLYPNGKAFAQETNQPENSPGFSTMVSNGNRVTARRTNLRADHPQLLTAILPHEVTHVVLADLFTTQQIPRWADEGIAVLAEPTAEQKPPRGRAARAPGSRPGLRPAAS